MPVTDYFALLGIERQFQIDEATLEANYRERSKQSHPDRHVGADAGTRAQALGQTMDLNKALKALRKPQSRAEHLLALHGVDIEGGGLDASFLAEILELREELDDAIVRADEDELEKLEESMLDRRDEILKKVAQGFATVESDGDREQALLAIKRSLIELRYVGRYLEQFDELGEAA